MAADWGAGWRQAGAAVADAVSMYQRNQQLSRQEAAENARRKREEKLDQLRIEMEKQKIQEDTRRFDLQFEAGRKDKDRAYGLQREKFEFDKSDPYKQALTEESRARTQNDAARLGLQREEMAQRERLATTRGLSQPDGPTANRVDTALMQEYAILANPEAGFDPEAQDAAARIYASNLSPQEKLARLRQLRGRASSKPQTEMIQ